MTYSYRRTVYRPDSVATGASRINKDHSQTRMASQESNTEHACGMLASIESVEWVAPRLDPLQIRTYVVGGETGRGHVGFRSG